MTTRLHFVARLFWILTAIATSFGSFKFTDPEDCMRAACSDDIQSKQSRYHDLSNVRLLVVGGTDGSGTRGVVALLERLGIPMVYDDAVSRDVHGAELGGWPGLIEPLLWATAPNAGQYEYSTQDSCFMLGPNRFPPRVADLPDATVDAAEEALAKVVRSALKKRRAMRPDEFRNSKDRNSNAHGQRCVDTYGIDVGIKAPVTLAVVPLLLKLGLRSVKLLHVVRDVRDLAFSSNQSPVEKFFNATFGAHCWASEILQQQFPTDNAINNDKNGYGTKGLGHERRVEALRAAHMWSTWNHGVYQWASTCAKAAHGLAGETATEDILFPTTSNCAPLPRFEYQILRIEDLLAVGGNTASVRDSAEFASTSACTSARLAAVAKLAEFTESAAARVNSELCCLCAEPAPDLGRSIDFKRLKEKLSRRAEASPEVSTERVEDVGNDDERIKSIGGDRKSARSFYQGYGKWRSFVTMDPLLGDALHGVTNTVLSTFGYNEGLDKVDPAPTRSGESGSAAAKQEVERQATSLNPTYEGSGMALPTQCSDVLGSTATSATTCAQPFMGHVASEAQPNAASSSDLDSVTGVAIGRNSKSRSIAQWHAAPCSFLGGVSVASPMASFAPGANNPLTSSVVRAKSAEQCCAICHMSSQAASRGEISKSDSSKTPLLCEHFAFDVHIGACHIMDPPQGFARHAGFISGWLAR